MPRGAVRSRETTTAGWPPIYFSGCYLTPATVVEPATSMKIGLL